ncbi:hypothetical protein [Persicobacter psychrovividus]|uniref:Uncharacterized protein n=1 Tax=Persicobacter psychrovividus TaxID=387638 RepID=A0ABM7VM78_9BACT|nr:hypothetical protein PEPS_43940 [Persicobacter psychrovividus]
MDLLKLSTDWARAEVFSAKFFILFGLLFILATIGFYQLGKTEVAKAYVYPTLVVGILLTIIGAGLLYANTERIRTFEVAYRTDAKAFLESEIDRAEKTIKEYETVVFTAIPIIIIACALLIIFLNTPTWRAISITTIAMMVCILLVDGTAQKRIAEYHEQLLRINNN